VVNKNLVRRIFNDVHINNLFRLREVLLFCNRPFEKGQTDSNIFSFGASFLKDTEKVLFLKKSGLSAYIFLP
jgi:hypothetical protein